MSYVRPDMGKLITIEQRHRDAAKILRAAKSLERHSNPTSLVPQPDIPCVIVEIGQCVGCGCRGRLAKGACEPCRNQFGQNAGTLMSKIRSDREYARLCYLSLDAPHQKRVFIRMFGLPPGCRAS
jgi:hypothetical protein